MISLTAFPQVLLIAVVAILVARCFARRSHQLREFATMLAIAAWITCSFAVGLFANALGRSGATWTIFSLILSPSLGLIVVAVLDKKWNRSARVMTAIGPAAVSMPV